MTNPIFNAYQGSDLFGKIIFLLLVFLSIVTWTLFLKKFFLQLKAKQKGSQLQETFKKKRLNPLGIETRESENPFSILYTTFKQATMELLGKNHAALEENATVYLSRSDIDFIEAHLMGTISNETKQLEKNLFVLATVVSLAPFLGLLGTVWGILLTFGELQSGASANANATIMGGLAMALGTTVLGLLVAIPALIAYNYLKAAIAGISQEMEHFSQLMLASVELQYRQIEIK